MSPETNHYDVLIAGGGPAGCTCALLLARQGFKVCLFEKTAHPRFHIGESILPRTTPLLHELGLHKKVMQLPHVPKYGAEFGFGDDFSTMKFLFKDGLVGGSVVFNIERANLDKLLFDEARNAGATVLENTSVRQIKRLEAGAVELETDKGTFTGRILMDCSGHGTIVGRHLKQRRNFEDPELQKVAYFQHFENVERLPGEATGHPTIIMTKEGWFWLIGLTETKTSIGFVTRPGFVKQLATPPERLLQWAISRCPVVKHRMRNATGPSENQILADFSFTCAPQAGPGFFMVGDAGCFLDPIFSTGVTLAMMGAREASRHAGAILRNEVNPTAAAAEYRKFITKSTGIFWWMIRNYYKHSFRELFMNGSGPMQVHKAVISILAGQVFPKPVWALRWRLRAFAFFVWAQQYVPLVPRRRVFSLMEESSESRNAPAAMAQG